MREIFNIEDYTLMLECNGEKGTGIFISSKSPEFDFVVTAKHCVDKYKYNSDIKFVNKDYSIKKVFLHEKLDLAVIQIEKDSKSSLFSYINYNDLEQYEGSIFLYGYPNFIRDERINSCKFECKYYSMIDNLMQLEVMQQISTFNFPAIKLLEGMSGGPVYIKKNDVIIFLGIYYQNSYDDFAYNRIDIIPLETIENLISDNNLEKLNLSFLSNISEEKLDPLYYRYEKLAVEDYRNLKEKIIDVCPEYNTRKISLFSRKVASTMIEVDRLTEKRKLSLLYRVFLAVNEKQIDLVIEGKNSFTENEVDIWLERYISYAKEIIDEKSEEYDYILKSKDIIKGIIFQLMNDCYISLDEEGYYEEGEDN